jgi:HD-GYP domain-containing protein (c-di-GMP phosphodiesterase class II)
LADEAAIETARIAEVQRQAEADELTVLEGLVELLERRCPMRLGHARRLAGLAAALGRRLRLSQAELAILYRAGLLADIGLSLIEPSRLNTPEPLTAADWVMVRAHPTASAQLLGGVGRLAEVAALIDQHHERYDGQGYPHRLVGVAIPLGSRVLRVADTVVAMLSQRPYRPVLPIERVEQALTEGAGSDFDPVVVEAALTLAAEGNLARLAGASPPALPSGGRSGDAY